MGRVVVVYGGGFQPFHTGHMSSYVQAKQAFPKADMYVVASNDTKVRPIPFAAKKFLAQQAGVKDQFVQVVAPVSPKEVLDKYNPEQDIFILVRSERDPMSYQKKDGSPAYFQPFISLDKCEPFAMHGYVFVTKKHVFNIGGVEIFSGSQVRSMYAKANDTGKVQLIKGLYPKSPEQKKIKMVFDKYLSAGPGVTEGNKHNKLLRKQADAQLGKEIMKQDPKKNVQGANPLVVGRHARNTITLEQRLKKELRLLDEDISRRGILKGVAGAAALGATGAAAADPSILASMGAAFANGITRGLAAGAVQKETKIDQEFLPKITDPKEKEEFIASVKRRNKYASLALHDDDYQMVFAYQYVKHKKLRKQLMKKYSGGGADAQFEEAEPELKKPIKPFSQVKQYPLDALLTGYGNGEELQASPEYKRDVRQNKQRLAQKTALADRVKKGYSDSNDEGDWAQE